MPKHSSSITVQNVCDAYLADRRNPFAEPRCATPQTLAVHLKVPMEIWGALTVKEFASGTKRRIAEARQTWLEAGLKPGTVAKRIGTLKTAFRFAVREEMIKRSHEPSIIVPKGGRPRERFVHPLRELPSLLAAADAIQTPDHILLFTELALRTGQRRSAINALKWEHIDFEQRVILFRETQAPEERTSKRRKNQPIDDELFVILSNAKERAQTEHVIEFRGKPVRSCYQGMKALYKRAGLKNIHVHDLRRSSATYVYDELGGDIDKAASHLGDTRDVTMTHYVQGDARVNLGGVQAVGGVLGRARSIQEERRNGSG